MDLGFLNPLFDRPGPWATVYLDTSLNTEDAAARQELAARDACDRLTQLGADEGTHRAMYEALTELPRVPEPPGRAVFVADGEVVLTPTLSAPPQNTLASFSALPHTSPLLELTDDKSSCLVAYIDRTGADFELRDAQGAREAGGVRHDEWPLHRTASKSWSERHFQNSVENTWDATAAAVAEALVARRAETHAELLVLVGEPRERRAVHERLPESLRADAHETEHGGRAAGATSPPLEREIAKVRAERAERNLAEVAERFQAGRAPDAEGRFLAVDGVPALVDAAREHRVETLLVRPGAPDVTREVWVGREPDQLALRRSEVQYLGDTRPVTVHADDALLRSAALTDVEVVPVRPGPGVPDELPVGGLGALLRWPADAADRPGEPGPRGPAGPE